MKARGWATAGMAVALLAVTAVPAIGLAVQTRPTTLAECRKAFAADIAATPANYDFSQLPTTLRDCRDLAQWSAAATKSGVLPPGKLIGASTVALFECAVHKIATGPCKTFSRDLASPGQGDPNANGAFLPCSMWWNGIATVRAGESQVGLGRLDEALSALFQNVSTLFAPPTSLVSAARAFEAAPPSNRVGPVLTVSRQCVQYGAPPPA